jgi:hypothetical protein
MQQGSWTAVCYLRSTGRYLRSTGSLPLYIQPFFHVITTSLLHSTMSNFKSSPFINSTEIKNLNTRSLMSPYFEEVAELKIYIG